jgi:predicted RNase H-like nuclease (RuvC/YqgF family)
MSEFKTDHAAELRRMSRKCIPSRGPWGDIPATMVQAATHIDELRDSLAAATRERDEARALNAAWAEKAATWMASPEAAQRLQGYRDMGQQVAEAQKEIDALRAEVEACAPYLKEGETPAERIKREIDDNAAVLSLLTKSRAEVERLRSALSLYRFDRDMTGQYGAEAALTPAEVTK